MRKNIEENYKNEQTTDEAATRVLLVGVDDGSDDDFENSMEELGSLAQACNMEPAGMITQKMERGHAQGHGSSQEQGHLQQEQNTKKGHKSLYVGTGKLQEIKEAVQFMEADLVIFDDALTPSQLRNLQAELDKPIMDRTTLILNIFESRARTREAKMQVESAKLKYMLPRLVGMHEALTRQGGTSGSMSSRGAGEKKLELDRRRIEHRITELNRDLQEIAKERQVQRKQRQKARIPLVALVGYTNAGKSTVMNAMIDAYMENGEKKVVEKDMLFATLDTTVRRICTGNNRDFLLSDTVGFIHKLPHGLVKAFRSTLEEVENADLLLHIVDYSDPHFREQMDTTKQLLAELETGNIPMITVFNKADKCGEEYPKKAGGQRVFISAKDQESVRFLAGLILESIYKDYMESEFLIPYERGDVVSYFMEHSHMISSEFEEQGTRIQVRCHPADRDKYAAYSCWQLQDNKMIMKGVDEMESAEREGRKDEKVDGVVYSMSPAPNYRHSIINNNINTIIKQGLKNSLCLVFMENLEYKYHPDINDDYFCPDIMIVCGRKELKGGAYSGVPKFIAETLSPSTAKRDKTIKKDAYEKAGIEEYWIVAPNGILEIYYLVDGKYVLEQNYILQADQEEADYNADITIALRAFPNITMTLKDVFENVD